MSKTKRYTTISLSVITTLLALWQAVGWISIAQNGPSWSDAIAMSIFSVVLIVLSLTSASLWWSHTRGAAVAFLVLAALALVSLIVSLA